LAAVAEGVKVHVLSAANGIPARSMAAVVIVAVYGVLAARSLVGSKVATEPMEVTVPETGVAPCFKVKLVAVIVAGSIASLKVAVTFLLTTAPMPYRRDL
jgi:hypothetical protein